METQSAAAAPTVCVHVELTPWALAFCLSGAFNSFNLLRQENGGLEIEAASQWLDLLKTTLGPIVGLPAAKIKVRRLVRWSLWLRLTPW